MRRVLFLVSCLISLPLAADELTGRSPAAWPDLAPSNFLDERIFARLRELNVVPSSLSTDAEFLRRLSLTTIGQLPTSAEVRSFLADDRPDKRARKIESAAQSDPAKALGGPELAASDPRVALMDWLSEPQNPFFSRNLVNRVWAHHFGLGVVEPLDGFSAQAPQPIRMCSTYLRLISSTTAMTFGGLKD